MAKETKETKLYPLTDWIKRQRYSAKIDGRDFLIDFERTFKNEPTSRFSGVGSFKNGEFKISELGGFKDLTLLQLRELATANVVKVDATDKVLIHGKPGD